MLLNARSAIPTATNAISQASIALVVRLECILLPIQHVSPLVPINITRMIRLKVVHLVLLLALPAITAIYAVPVPLVFFTPNNASPPVLLKPSTTLRPTTVFPVLITALLAKIHQVFA